VIEMRTILDHMGSPRRLFGAGAVVLALVVAGCGGGYSSGSASKPSTTKSSTATSSIPQHNGGDMDADNNGGPSDGDGNI
jgi:hypothetical protein